jgi:hypothetical protein
MHYWRVGLRLLYTAMLAIAVSHLVIAQSLVQEESTLFSESLDMMASQVMLSITAFESIWSLGLIIFGLHLIVIGFVAFMSPQIPKYISILAAVAGCSYVFIHFMDRFIPELEHVTSILETILLLPMTIGELTLGIWLLIKGRKLKSLD